MVKLRAEKTKLFGELQEGQARMASIIQNFTVFPSGFQQKCVTVQQGLQDLKTIETKLENFVVQLDESAQTLQHRKTAIMNEKGISSWQIKNSKFSNLLEHFTITAHKEAAGKIGGFAIEKGSSSGEVTLF